MKALVIEKPGHVTVKEVEDPEPGRREVLVKVKACGICGTDMHIFRGELKVKYPVIPGHEISGEVVSLGRDVASFKTGDRVAIDPNISCGECHYCRNGMPHFCENWEAIGIHRPGGYAEYVVAPVKNVYKIPSGLSLEAAALAEPVACCIHGQDFLDIKFGDIVAIFGLGPIGLIHLQLARSRGASKIIGIDLVEDRLQMALELGADHVINGGDPHLADKVNEITGGRGVDKVVEATGNPMVLKQAIRVSGYGSKILVFGVAPEHSVTEVEPFLIYRKELTIIGSFVNPFTMQRALKTLASRIVDADKIITHKIGLNEAPEYFKGRLAIRKALKILVVER